MAKDKQFAVIGLGRFGSSVAKTLHQLGYEVLAIDSNEETVQKFADEVTHVAIADTTDANSLKALGIRNFDVVVVAIGEDVQANVLTTLVVKELGVHYIIAKARNELHGKMLEKIGADKIVYPERDMGQRVAHNLVSTNVLDYVELSPNLGLVEVRIPRKFIGQSLAEVNLRATYGVNVVAIKRGQQLIVSPRPDEKMNDNDILIVVGDTSGIQRLESNV
ncbi:potassium channel family protein [Acetonema longum]|uniref:TrkA-N domain protein n=1 Tax=Acetonema longum DSM 6540 TaxID=1009370 RepID=F7NNF7_9FIRM|nr:TrkA family potassium uptake protein [Acetonema longum]EGO62398.1 TrkA-N domain protein [Acetonema longum DSM 6540]